MKNAFLLTVMAAFCTESAFGSPVEEISKDTSRFLADDGAPLCSKAGQDEAQDFTEDMEDEIEEQMNEMMGFYMIDKETNYIRNAVCLEWSEPLKNLQLSTYY